MKITLKSRAKMEKLLFMFEKQIFVNRRQNTVRMNLNGSITMNEGRIRSIKQLKPPARKCYSIKCLSLVTMPSKISSVVFMLNKSR